MTSDYIISFITVMILQLQRKGPVLFLDFVLESPDEQAIAPRSNPDKTFKIVPSISSGFVSIVLVQDFFICSF